MLLTPGSSAALGVVVGAAAMVCAQRITRERRSRLPWSGANPGFRVEGEEKQAYKRFLQVQDRTVVYPDGRSAAFDIVGHPRGEYQFAEIGRAHV